PPGRSSGRDGRQKPPADVLRGPRPLLGGPGVARVLLAVDAAKAGARDLLEVVVDGVALGTEPVLRAVLLEVRLDPDASELGVERREDEPPPWPQRRERLVEEATQVGEVLGHQRRHDGVEAASPDGELPVEIGLRELGRGRVPPRDAQHPAREVDADRPTARRTQAAEVRPRAAARIEYPLAGLRIERAQRVAPIHRDQRVRRGVVGLRPPVVSVAHARSLHAPAHRRVSSDQERPSRRTTAARIAGTSSGTPSSVAPRSPSAAMTRSCAPTSGATSRRTVPLACRLRVAGAPRATASPMISTSRARMAEERAAASVKRETCKGPRSGLALQLPDPGGCFPRSSAPVKRSIVCPRSCAS